MNYILYIALGLIAGMLSGLLGIGGGVILVPAFVFLLGMTQHQAQGTTLALMVPPIGILAALRYYQAGNVKMQVAVLVCLGFLAGGYFGAHFAQKLPELFLKRVYGLLMLGLAVKMIIGK